jgi:hypothetical protein
LTGKIGTLVWTITAGADASIPLGDFLLRLETAWTGGGRYERPATDIAAILMDRQTERPWRKNGVSLRIARSFSGKLSIYRPGVTWTSLTLTARVAYPPNMP